ncbi:MAG: NAD(P)/FAD-dependent oxidoreductase [Bacteroidota bacterium]
MKEVQYLIVGQGIAGSLLSWELEKRGLEYIVFDRADTENSSFKAAGLYNPITGRKMVKTWLADKIFPGLEAFYREIEVAIGIKVIFPKNIYRPFMGIDEQNDWQGRLTDCNYSPFIDSIKNTTLGIEGLIDPFGGIMIRNSGYVDVPELMIQYKNWLFSNKKFKSGVFESNKMTIERGTVKYEDIVAEKVIFCEGAHATNNNYWKYLPFRPVKGEIMEVVANFQRDLIVNRNVFIVPKSQSFLIGSTYDHKHLDNEPSEAGMRNIQDRLSKIFNIEYSVKGQWAGVRPATFDRRPFIGLHPEHPEIGIFNGFGTKGVSLVPFFAAEFVNFLLGNQQLTPEVDIVRVLRK